MTATWMRAATFASQMDNVTVAQVRRWCGDGTLRCKRIGL